MSYILWLQEEKEDRKLTVYIKFVKISSRLELILKDWKMLKEEIIKQDELNIRRHVWSGYHPCVLVVF